MTAGERILQTVKQADEWQARRGASWYPDVWRFCQTVERSYDIPAYRVAGVIAALSPAAPWESNILSTLTLIRFGCTVGPILPRSRLQALRILQGSSPLDVLRGPKVRSFFACIVQPATSQSPCIDRHAASLALGYRLDRFTGKVYNEIGRAYRAVARALGKPVAEAQAIAWVVYRDALRYREVEPTLFDNLVEGG